MIDRHSDWTQPRDRYMILTFAVEDGGELFLVGLAVLPKDVVISVA